jgi:DNA-binding transcriptional LysR family regulator
MKDGRDDGADVGGSEADRRGYLQLSTVDLNLLLPLQALLELRSVSRAAERMYMSQPALSSALARLRKHFGDELLRRSGNHLVLSPLGARLLEEVGGVSSALLGLFGTRGDFVPATSQREFRIVCSDYVSAGFGARLSRLVSRVAPSVSLHFEQMQDDLVDGAPDSLRDVDGLIVPHGYLQHPRFIDLFEDQWWCLVAREANGAELTVEDLGTRPWATTFSGRTAILAATRQLREQGIYPRTQVTTRSFLALPHMIEGTDRVAFLPSQLVPTDSSTVRGVPCPLVLPALREAFWWSDAHEEDPSHQWLRGMLVEAAKMSD